MPDEAYVSIRMVDFGTNIVHIGNSGAEKGEVGLLRICQNSVCTNETVNELEISAIVPVNGVDLGELDEAGGEVALFQEEAGGSVLLSYVTWGEGEKEHLELASEQGLWSAGESLDGGDKTFIQARQPVPDGPGDWVVAR